jgi:hypothetical protein
MVIASFVNLVSQTDIGYTPTAESRGGAAASNAWQRDGKSWHTCAHSLTGRQFHKTLFGYKIYTNTLEAERGLFPV